MSTSFPCGKKTETGTDWMRGLVADKEGLGNVSEGRSRLVFGALPESLSFKGF